MAIVKKLTQISLERATNHTEVEATYCIITDERDQKYLQIDSYGSAQRKIAGKKSQSLRFTPEAIIQLREILERDFKKS